MSGRELEVSRLYSLWLKLEFLGNQNLKSCKKNQRNQIFENQVSNKSKYFGLGNINQDQLVDYAKRRNISVEKAQKWLSPNLN